MRNRLLVALEERTLCYWAWQLGLLGKEPTATRTWGEELAATRPGGAIRPGVKNQLLLGLEVRKQLLLDLAGEEAVDTGHGRWGISCFLGWQVGNQLLGLAVMNQLLLGLVEEELAATGPSR